MEVRDSWTSIRAITVAGLTPWRPANGHLPMHACHVAKRSHHTSSARVDARDIAPGLRGVDEVSDAQQSPPSRCFDAYSDGVIAECDKAPSVTCN
jgi:hypothetical protein